MNRSRRPVAALGALLLAFASVQTVGTAADAVPEASGTNVSVASSTAATPWVGTWATAMQNTSAAFTGKTLRQIVHTSIGGTTARIHLSNQFNSVPVTVSDVHIARTTSGSAVDTTSDKRITFSGVTSVTIPTGGEVVSDAADFAVPADANVTISFYVPTTTGYMQHETAQQTNYYADGDQSGNADLSGGLTYSSYSLLSNLDVQNTAATGSVVAFGASITDAVASSFGANRRWPNLLAKRLNGSGRTVGVLNEGISGNNLLFDGSGQKALTRFGHDVVQQPGVKWVIISDDPINDLLRSAPPSAQDLINGLSQLISQAHTAQIKVLCSTLTPFKGTTVGAGWSTQAESGRDTINAFLRGSSSGCDGIVDQDAATHNPSDPQAFRPDLDTGDHLHPNDAGMQVIADAVPLSLIGPAGTPQPATISLKASNGLFVAAENAGADPLIANRTAVGTWEKFDVTYLSGDQVRLRSEANGLFVAAENAGADPLIANRTTASLWETFHLIRNSDGTCSLVSEANNLYVNSNNGTAPLIANQTANNGWEHFTVAAA